MVGEDAAAVGVVRFLSARVSGGGVLYFSFFPSFPFARPPETTISAILLLPFPLYYNAAVKRDEKPQREKTQKSEVS